MGWWAINQRRQGDFSTKVKNVSASILVILILLASLPPFLVVMGCLKLVKVLSKKRIRK